MKLFFLFTFAAMTFTTNAATYYFSSKGSDDNTGRSVLMPWKTLMKFNAVFNSVKPGDSLLFRRGDVFYGKMTISRSGAAGKPVTIGAYGMGVNPVITGFTTVGDWKNLGANTWESSSEISTLPTCNMVTIKGVSYAMGRYPNTGYLYFQSHNNNTSITSNSLKSSVTNWQGAELVIRMNRFIIDRDKITGHSGNTLTFTSQDKTYTPKDNWGFFIQNDPGTLDIQNEWFYDPVNKKIKIFSTSMPTDVRVSTIDTIVFLDNRSFIVFNELSFYGSNKISIKVLRGDHITIKNCHFNYSGSAAIDSYPNTGFFQVTNCTFNNSNNFAINAGASSPDIITNNIIKNTGVFAGMGGEVSEFKAIHASGHFGNISYNTIENTGYLPIDFDGDATIVENNYINNFCFVTDDGGGIYTTPSQGVRVNKQRSIKHNIVLNGLGAGAGTDAPKMRQANGIYLDGTCSNFDVTGNIVENTQNGIFLNNCHEVNIDSNTVYNNNYQVYFRKYVSSVEMTNISLTNNFTLSKTATQQNLNFYFERGNAQIIPKGFVADNNYYARPIDDNYVFRIGSSNIQLADWQKFSGQDIHSHKSPKTISDTNDLRFEFNETGSPKTVPLGNDYIDVRNESNRGTLILAPYKSVIMIRTKIR